MLALREVKLFNCPVPTLEDMWQQRFAGKEHGLEALAQPSSPNVSELAISRNGATQHMSQHVDYPQWDMTSADLWGKD